MITINTEYLRKHCDTPLSNISGHKATKLVHALRSLASWWLKPEVLQLARKQSSSCTTTNDGNVPKLPSKLGSCWVIFAAPNKWPLLRSAMLLPLQWKQGQENDPNLPKSLSKLADLVVEQCQSELDDQHWGLQLHQSLADSKLNLSELDQELTSDSGYGSLVGGLILAKDGILPDPSIWATVAFDATVGIAPVNHLKEKIDLALEWKAHEIFVSTENYRNAIEIVESQSSNLQIQQCIPQRNSNASRLLQDYLAALGVQPKQEHDFKIREAYYMRMTANVDDYEFTHLLQDNIYNAVENLSYHPELEDITHLITTVGLNKCSTAFGIGVIKPKHCLLLYDSSDNEGKIQQHLNDLLKMAEQDGVQAQTASFNAKNDFLKMKDELAQIIFPFHHDIPKQNVAFDLTPGFKHIAMAFREIAPPGAMFCYTQHKPLGQNRFKPLSQRLEVWRV